MSQYFDVDVVPRPEITGYEITFDGPEYLGYSETVRRDADDADLEGPLGCRVTISATFANAVESAELKIAGQDTLAGSPVADSGSRTFSWTVELDDELVAGRTWSIAAEDQFGFKNWPREFLMRAIRDRGPTVTLIDPTEDQLRLKRTDTLPITFRVEDDHAIETVTVRALVDGQPRPPIRVPLFERQGRPVFNEVTHVALATITDRTSRTVTLQIAAEDNYPVDWEGPHLGLSPIITIVLDETAESYFERQGGRDYASLKEALQQTLERLQAAEQAAEPLEALVDTDERLSDDLRDRIDSVRDEAQTARDILLEVAETLPETSFAALLPEVQALADTDVARINESAADIKLHDDARSRAESASQANRSIDDSIERTEALLGQLDQLWENLQRVADIQDLANRQAELARQLEPQDQTQVQTQPINELVEPQRQLLREVADQLQQSPDALDELIEAMQQEFNDLAAEARDLAEQQQAVADLTEQSNSPETDLEQLAEQIADAIEQQQQRITADTQQLDEAIEQEERAGDDQTSDLASAPEQVLTS
ncbi:MAG: hypothetical protein R3B96_05850 [Pirellulaceae bacterium]